MAQIKYPKDTMELANAIQQAISDNTFFRKTENENTHVAKHVIKDESAILNKVLSSDGSKIRKSKTSLTEEEKKERRHKITNSGFPSLDKACAAIEECIMSQCYTVAQWAEEADEHRRESFDIYLSPDAGYGEIGYGYALNHDLNTIDEYKTNNVKVVLEKDSQRPLGFVLVTAYPDITKEENRELTGRDITEITKQTERYKNASPVSKAYMLYQIGTVKPYLATFKKGERNNIHDDVLSIHIPKGEDCKDIIRIKENSIEFSRNKLTDVKVARWHEKGKHKEKIIYPGEDESKYHKSGVSIVTEKKFVKSTSFFTRHFAMTDENSMSVDLTRPDVFKSFEKRYPDAAIVVKQCMDVLNNDGANHFKQKEENLNESLMPRYCLEREREVNII